MTAYGATTQFGGMLQPVRAHESEADMIGLALIAVLNNPDTAVLRFGKEWQYNLEGNHLRFIGTHP